MNKNKKKEILNNKDENKVKLILLISWLLPFFGLYVIYFLRIKIPQRAKMILCETLNKNMTFMLIYLSLIYMSNVFMGRGNIEMAKYIINFMLVIFCFSMILQIKYTYYYCLGKDIRYRYTIKLFKELNNG